MAVAFLGGSFDPIHYGHLLVGELAREQLGVSTVAFAPTGEPPHKRERRLSPVADRVAMTRLAIADNPAFRLSLVDVNRPGPHYTVDTAPLARAELAEPGELYLIIGADHAEALLTWRQPELLIQRWHLAVVARPGHQLDLAALEPKLPGLTARTRVVEMPLLSLSSTELRRRAAAGLSLRYQTPPAVEAYIREHRLYRPNE